MKIESTFNSSKVKGLVKKQIEQYGQTEALRLEGEAKRNRSWQDDTGNARNSIQGKFSWVGNVGTIDLSGNVEYFPALELAYGKKYSILLPTIERLSTEILKGYERVINQ